MNRRSLIIATGGLLALGGASALGWRVSTGSIEDYAGYSAALRRELPADPTLHDLIGYATLAPNGHNTQP